ncbi:protein of unknown function [Methylocaldum szegediense]|uniref:Uncharacterized protein n=1 Tax=Methylocaldum szegediense TaxID=73780 RepID=A0ABM9I8F9_9GAMM|nr:protein of unknown function [Methylocaldum szegediense]
MKAGPASHLFRQSLRSQGLKVDQIGLLVGHAEFPRKLDFWLSIRPVTPAGTSNRRSGIDLDLAHAVYRRARNSGIIAKRAFENTDGRQI